VALWERGERISCTPKAVGCRKLFTDAAEQDFGPGTTEFCAFGIEVAPPTAGQSTTPCRDGLVIGNGKGIPVLGAELETVLGDKVRPYKSTTSIKHEVDGAFVYLDAAIVPATVVPKGRKNDLGTVVWVRHPDTGRTAFAIAGDVGPDYGEGSIALHQWLRTGALTAQKPGWIPKDRRCGVEEMSLAPPFTSEPDLPGDICRPRREVRAGTDIRAEAGIAEVEMYYLAKARFAVDGHLIREQVSMESIRERARKAGYTSDRLNAMARCLSEAGSRALR
jgi:hypothetical protein